MGPNRLTLRTREEIAAFFDGLDLVDPGLVPLPQWRAVADSADPVPAYAGIGRKPGGTGLPPERTRAQLDEASGRPRN